MFTEAASFRPPSPADHDPGLEKMLLRDFYLSFKYSQGSPNTQHYLFDALSNRYRETHDPESIQLASATALNPQRVSQLMVPSSHSEQGGQTPGEKYPLTFKMEAEKFVTAISKETPAPLEGIYENTLERDVLYQTSERSFQAIDPHSSYFRQYVLLGEQTGSESFNDIFTRVNEWGKVEFADNPRLDDELILQASWEAWHPGESFYPAEPTPQ